MDHLRGVEEETKAEDPSTEVCPLSPPPCEADGTSSFSSKCAIPVALYSKSSGGHHAKLLCSHGSKASALVREREKISPSRASEAASTSLAGDLPTRTRPSLGVGGEGFSELKSCSSTRIPSTIKVAFPPV